MPEEKPNPALNLAYRLDFEHPIWQIRFDAETGWLALECRDAEVLQVSFWVLAASTGELLLNNYQPAKSWWTGLAAVKKGLLFLHQLGGAQNLGQPQGIISLSVMAGAVKWQRQDVIFYGLTENNLLVRPVTEETAAVVGLNIETGTVAEETVSIKGEIVNQGTFQAEGVVAIQLPAHYPAESEYFMDLSRFVLLKTGYAAQWAIDYLESKSLIVIGFYPDLLVEEKTYWVAVFSQKGELLMQEALDTALTGLGTDNFFLFHEQLFLLKDKKSLLAFRF